jgi:hypothetical protein
MLVEILAIANSQWESFEAWAKAKGLAYSVIGRLTYVTNIVATNDLLRAWQDHLGIPRPVAKTRSCVCCPIELYRRRYT